MHNELASGRQQDKQSLEDELFQTSLAQAQRLHHKWGKQLQQVEASCPFCKGSLKYRGVSPGVMSELAGDKHPVPEFPLIYLLTFGCAECGYLARFDESLFDLHRLLHESTRQRLAIELTFTAHEVFPAFQGMPPALLERA